MSYELFHRVDNMPSVLGEILVVDFKLGAKLTTLRNSGEPKDTIILQEELRILLGAMTERGRCIHDPGLICLDDTNSEKGLVITGAIHDHPDFKDGTHVMISNIKAFFLIGNGWFNPHGKQASKLRLAIRQRPEHPPAP